MPQATVEVGQATMPAPVEEHQTDEQRYQEEIAQLEATIRRAEDLYDQAEQAVWAQAQRYAAIQAIDALGGFRQREITPPTESREVHWRATLARDQGELTRLLEERKTAVQAIEQARGSLNAKQSAWQQARAREAFLATEAGQVLARELQEIEDAYSVAQKSNQSHMLRVLAVNRGNVRERILLGTLGLLNNR